MNEIRENLWLGDFRSALNTQQLRDNKIHSVLSVMRGKHTFDKTFIRLQIEIDDTYEADILSHFIPAIRFITGELEKGRGVLVHCLAGISRSPTIVAAYLIHTLNISPDEALGIIVKQRPFVQPNTNFIRQLNLFHYSQGKISQTDKDIRRFYLEKTVHDITTSGGSSTSTSRPTTEMLSSFPNSTGLEDNPTGPTTVRQRRIRCRMCRHDLAAREHMLDHGQLPVAPPSALSVSSSPEIAGVDSSGLDLSSAGASDSSGVPAEDASPTTTTNPDPPIHSSIPSEQTDTSPLLINPKCSGYFVEPMKWMDHFLSVGLLVGKITCPNTKCNAKLGNYDWAGVCCGCKTWVTPGFCINRSKVDEIV